MSDLTYLQKLALRGELARIFSLYGKHDDDIPFGCFMALSMYTTDYFKDIVSILEELVDEDIVKRVVFYYQSRIVPYDIYANKMVSDISYHLQLSGDSVCEILYIRSIFASFILRLKEISPIACHVVLNKVLQDKDLELLHEDAFYLRSNIKLPVEVKSDNEDDSMQFKKFAEDCNIFSVSVMSSEILNFADMITNEPEDDTTNKNTTSIYDDIRMKFADVPSTSYFIVDKIDVLTEECVSTRNFVSIDDVITYLQNIDIEELASDTYKYIVSEGVKTDG